MSAKGFNYSHLMFLASIDYVLPLSLKRLIWGSSNNVVHCILIISLSFKVDCVPGCSMANCLLIEINVG